MAVLFLQFPHFKIVLYAIFHAGVCWYQKHIHICLYIYFFNLHKITKLPLQLGRGVKALAGFSAKILRFFFIPLLGKPLKMKMDPLRNVASIRKRPYLWRDSC